MPNLNLNTPKKTGTGKVVLNIFLVLLVICLGSYIIYDKMIEKPKVVKKVIKEESKMQSMDVTAKEVTSLYSSVDIFSLPSWNQSEYYGYLYKQDNLKSSDMSDDIKVLIGIENILKEK